MYENRNVEKSETHKNGLLPCKVHTQRVECASFSPNGSFVTCAKDGVVALWEWNGSLSPPRVVGQLSDKLTQCAVSSSQVAVAGKDLHILGSTWRTIEHKGDEPISYLFFSPSGKYLASGNPFHVCPWETSSGNQLWSSPSSSLHPQAFTMHEGNEFLVCGRRNGTYIVLNCAQLKKKLHFTIKVAPDLHVTHASWLPDGKMIAVVIDSYVYLWRVNLDSLLQVGTKEKKMIQRLTSWGSRDVAGLIYQYWRHKTPVTYHARLGTSENRYIDDISFSPNGERIAVSDDRTISIYNVDTGLLTCEESFDDNVNCNVEFTAASLVSERGIFLFQQTLEQDILSYTRTAPPWYCRDRCRSICNEWLLTPLSYSYGKLDQSQIGIRISRIYLRPVGKFNSSG